MMIKPYTSPGFWGIAISRRRHWWLIGLQKKNWRENYGDSLDTTGMMLATVAGGPPVNVSYGVLSRLRLRKDRFVVIEIWLGP